MSLAWQRTPSDEPGDQDADSRHGAHAYWSLGPDRSDTWGVELIVRDCDLSEVPAAGLHLGHFPTEADAKRHAEDAEAGELDIRGHRCEHD